MRQRQATERRQVGPPQLLATRGSRGDPGQTAGPSLCSRPSAAPAAHPQVLTGVLAATPGWVLRLLTF